MSVEQNYLVTQKKFNRNVKQRCGFSLLELILVLAVLLAVASLAVPVVQRTFSRQSIEKASGLVRASMGKARVKAIKTGQIHAVYYLPGFSWHGVAPFANATEQISVAVRRAKESEDRNPGHQFSDDLLPRGVVFAAGQAVEDARAAQAVADVGASSSSVKLVLFYPDGTSQDARIYLENDKGDLRRIELRGLTGTATSSKVERVSQ